MSSNPLDELRQGIRDIDSQILKLTSERMKLCRQVGEHKRKNNLPVKDYKVEKSIIEKTRETAKTLGIYPELAESVIKSLIKYSVLEQDEIKSHLKSKQEFGSSKKVLVIGGNGNMGQWISHFFEALGHQILINDVPRCFRLITSSTIFCSILLRYKTVSLIHYLRRQIS